MRFFQYLRERFSRTKSGENTLTFGDNRLQQIIANLRKIDPLIKVFASSGYSDDPIMAMPSWYDFTARLAKPYTLEWMATLLSDVMGKQ